MYLSNVKISNFRAFPEDFSLDITPGPGVTLVVGQNGLGKSTFFEAIEWCIAGEVKRLKDIPTEGSRSVDFLARRKYDLSEVDRYGVELFFQPRTETRIARWIARSGAGYVPEFETDQKTLIKELVSPHWKEAVTDIGAYLRLTHFLSQSVEQRFAAQDSKQRWTALESPAGAERLSRARHALGNKGVTAAFNKREASAQSLIKSSEQELARWEELLNRRDAARKLAESGGTISPEELQARLESLWLDSASLLGDLRHPKNSAIEDRLSHYGKRLEAVIPTVQQKIQSLMRINSMTDRWRRVIDSIAADQALRDSLQTQMSAAENDAQVLQSMLDETKDKLDLLMKRRADDSRERYRLSEHFELKAGMVACVASLQEIDSTIDELQRDLNLAVGESAAATAMLDNRKRLESDLSNATMRLAELRDLRHLVSRWSEARSTSTSIQTRLKNQSAIESNLDSDITRLNGELVKIGVSIEAATRILEKARVQASVIDAAVASIAAALDDNSTNCPVCATRFEPGVLKELISGTASTMAVGLNAHESALKAAEDARQAISREIGGLLIRKKALDDLSSEYERTDSITKSLESAMRSHPDLSSIHSNSEIAHYVDAALSGVESSINAINVTRSEGPELSTLSNIATNANLKRLTIETRLAEAQKSRDKIRGERVRFEQLIEDLEASAGGPLVIETRIKELAKQESELGLEIETFETQILRDRKAIRDTQAQSAATRIEFDRVCERLQAGYVQLEDMRSRWQSSGLQGDPSEETYQSTIDSLEDQRQRLTKLSNQHSGLVRGFEAWSKAQEYRDLQERINIYIAQEKAATESGVAELLRDKLEQARNELAKLQAAKKYRDQTVRKLESEARDYTTKVISPLDSLNKKFLQVFSCFSNMSLSLGTKTHQSSSRLEILLDRLSSRSESNTLSSIRHYLSEGQLSALSVSLLLSMSIAYRWSQWRALLLDDPLQHNDIIHAASFIEVLRNLVKFQEYQVILSTHDYQLADFVRRKMAAAKVDCRTCQFLGTKWQGVTHQVLY